MNFKIAHAKIRRFLMADCKLNYFYFAYCDDLTYFLHIWENNLSETSTYPVNIYLCCKVRTFGWQIKSAQNDGHFKYLFKKLEEGFLSK